MIGINDNAGGAAIDGTVDSWGRRPTVVFVHAHPDDEAIFTGGTLAALGRAGYRTVVLLATSGELGDRDPDSSLADLAARRRAEAQRSCRILGVDRLVFLDHVDSGLDTDRRERPWGAFVDVALSTAARQIADIAIEERATAIVTYDDHGIYGHPDHVHVHDAAIAAADMAGIATRYLATVDREYLHFVESHLIDHAGAAVPSIRPVGSSTVEVTTTVSIHDHLDAKQRAIAAHASQIGADPWLGVADTFGDVYGYEWYVRVGPEGPIDRLPAVPGTEGVSAPERPAAAPERLSSSELSDIATGLATAVRHGVLPEVDADRRTWWRLLATDRYDAWLIAWPPGGTVTPHDHGGSSGAFSVVSGELTEVVFTGFAEHGSRLAAGATRGVPSVAVHDVLNEGDGPALSVHVYSPPLSSMGYYEGSGTAPTRVESVDADPAIWSLPTRAATGDPAPTHP
ncbi:MAG: PIG-L family deacetylase [Acidimicrobiales bacterium]